MLIAASFYAVLRRAPRINERADPALA